MAALQNFKTQLKRLIPLVLLLVLLTTPSGASDKKHRRQHRQRQQKASPSSASSVPSSSSLSPSPPSSSSSSSSAAAAAATAGVNCPEPTEEDVRSAAGCADEMHESFFQYPTLRNACNDHLFETFENEKRGPMEIRHSPLDNSLRSKKCQPQVYHHAHGRVRDPCPITWVLNVDKNRVPRILLEGQCLNCTECMSMHRSSAGRSSIASPPDMTKCHEIYYYTKVLRRTTGCHWQAVFERITVGCACRAGPLKTARGKVGSKSIKPSSVI